MFNLYIVERKKRKITRKKMFQSEKERKVKDNGKCKEKLQNQDMEKDTAEERKKGRKKSGKKREKEKKANLSPSSENGK